jgi:catechol 2,3-dioxygenase-like lactoylglutathione lyase family enzyme
MKIGGFDHLVLRVNDLDSALSFYTEALGLEPLRVDEFRRGEVPFPSVRISANSLIDLVPKARMPGSNNVDHFCLVVEGDLDGLASELQARGVEVTGESGRRWGAHGWGNSIYVSDPEGNTIELKSYAEN